MGIKMDNSKGFSLVEIMVALLILSIGLLGVAGLQTAGLRENHNAYLRSQAALDANMIIDCMRANRTAKTSYIINIGASPTTGTVAGEDLADWKAMLATLPGPGDGSVSIAGTVVTVVVQWSDNGTQTIQVQTRL